MTIETSLAVIAVSLALIAAWKAFMTIRYEVAAEIQAWQARKQMRVYDSTMRASALKWDWRPEDVAKH